jgi:hypothetical protein
MIWGIASSETGAEWDMGHYVDGDRSGVGEDMGHCVVRDRTGREYGALRGQGPDRARIWGIASSGTGAEWDMGHYVDGDRNGVGKDMGHCVPF